MIEASVLKLSSVISNLSELNLFHHRRAQNANRIIKKMALIILMAFSVTANFKNQYKALMTIHQIDNTYTRSFT